MLCKLEYHSKFIQRKWS